MKNPRRTNFTDGLAESPRRRIAEQVARQDHVRTDPVVHAATEELQRLRSLAVERWGRRAIIQAQKDGALGYRLEIGYYGDDDVHLPPWKRREIIVATGRTYSEVLANLRSVEAVLS